jgi:hypothetical protein
MTDYAAKVAAGIKFLDSEAASGKISANWRDKVKLDSLDLGSCDVCVLGQLFGSYSDGQYELDLDVYDSNSYGFSPNNSYAELTQAWKDALGKSGVPVEKGDIYKDRYGYSVKVLSTTLVTLDNETITTYIVQTGEIERGAFKAHSEKSVTILRKKDFETDFTMKVEKFTPKKGMFVTTASGKNYYMISDDELRELKDGAHSQWLIDLSASERSSMREMVTAVGRKFSETIVK